MEGRVAREIVIPYAPRPQFARYHARAERWACIVAHRRAGKTVATINDTIRRALTESKRDARYGYIAPYYAQAKDVAWLYLKRYTAPIPGIVVNEGELRVTLPNGAMIRLYGADNYDRMRGLYFDGVVLDEPADMDPRAWPEVIRPTLADRGGWATFIGTPKGHNDFYDIYRRAGDDPAWLRMVLRASETGLIPPAELDELRKSLSEDQYNQEMECSFEAAIVGAYFGREMAAAEREGRIAGVPWQPNYEVRTAWDLGISDSTAIWFYQIAGQEIHIIDYLEHAGVGLDWYARELKSRPYVYAPITLPHDGGARELGTGKSREETLQSLGFKTEVLPGHRFNDGINALRLLLPRCWFDAKKCARGIEALKQYRREFDDKRKAFNDKPLHDWTSHAADAARYMAMGVTRPKQKSKPLQYDNRGIV